jgi:Carbohydrate esterase, sialic acid-specific acetylesterase
MRIVLILLLFSSCKKDDMIKMFFAQNANQLPPGSVDFYIIAGQSNCGRSTVSEMSGGEAAIYDVDFSNTYIQNPSASITPWTQINPGTNTKLGNPNASDEFGPEVSLSKKLNDRDSHSHYILKYGLGNTDLYNDWAPGSTYRNALKSYMEDCVIDALGLGKKLNIKAFIWMQGENDATNLTWANAYEANLIDLVDEIRTHWATLVTDNSLGTPTTMKCIIGRINGISDSSEIYRTTVRTAQDNFVAGDGNAILIDTDSYPLKDSVHYSATGQISFGIDIFNSLYP